MQLNSATSTATPTTRRPPATGHMSSCLIWKMTSNANEVRCTVKAAAAGLELQYALNGTLLSEYRFDQADDALSWAARKQLTLQKRGWERA